MSEDEPLELRRLHRRRPRSGRRGEADDLGWKRPGLHFNCSIFISPLCSHNLRSTRTGSFRSTYATTLNEFTHPDSVGAHTSETGVCAMQSTRSGPKIPAVGYSQGVNSLGSEIFVLIEPILVPYREITGTQNPNLFTSHSADPRPLGVY